MTTPHALVHHIAQHPLLPHTACLVVAVSGGPDSLALLHSLCQTFPVQHLRVYHLDHGLRGAQSAADAQFVVETARHLGVVVHADIADIAQEAPHLANLSEAARVVRYQRLAAYAAAQRADAVLVAHTQDDQAETVLMRLLRGSGTTGLAAMRPSVPWADWAPAHLQGHAALVRPLLDITRATIIDYCTHAQLTPRHDPSNTKQTALRVRVRTHILPMLQHEQPHIARLLTQTAAIAGDDDDFITASADQHWAQVAQAHTHGVGIDATVFRTYHASLQRALVRRAVMHVYGTLRNITMAHIESVRLAILAQRIPALALPAPMRITRVHDTLWIGTPPLTPAPVYLGQPHILRTGDPIDCGAFVLSATTRIAATPPDRWHVGLNPQHVYQVRTRQPGDRIGIGHGQHRRLQDVFVDARIAPAQRATWPVVCHGDAVVYIPGIRSDPAFCVDSGMTCVWISCLMSHDSTV